MGPKFDPFTTSTVPPEVLARVTPGVPNPAEVRVGAATLDMGTALAWPSTTTCQEREAPMARPVVHRTVTWSTTTEQLTPGNTRAVAVVGDAHADTTVVLPAGPKLLPFRYMYTPPAAGPCTAPGPSTLLMMGGA